MRELGSKDVKVKRRKTWKRVPRKKRGAPVPIRTTSKVKRECLLEAVYGKVSDIQFNHHKGWLNSHCFVFKKGDILKTVSASWSR